MTYLHSDLVFKPSLVFLPCMYHLSFKTAALSSNWLWWDWPVVTDVPMFLFLMTQPRPKLWVMSSGHRADGAKAGKSQREWNNAHWEWCTEGSWTGEDAPLWVILEQWERVWLQVRLVMRELGKESKQYILVYFLIITDSYWQYCSVWESEMHVKLSYLFFMT